VEQEIHNFLHHQEPQRLSNLRSFEAGGHEGRCIDTVVFADTSELPSLAMATQNDAEEEATRSSSLHDKIQDEVSELRSDPEESGCSPDANNPPNDIGCRPGTMLPPVTSSVASLDHVDSMLQMSCEAAAGIIASMRGAEHEELARIQLGCRGSAECNVKNVQVFQVLEMNF
jgi:hypothetical protein